MLKPVGIMFSEFYFYLIAWMADDSKDLYTVFRADRITNMEVKDEGFEIPYAQRFSEAEFRKRVQFMYTGKLKRVKFAYLGASLEVVFDRLYREDEITMKIKLLLLPIAAVFALSISISLFQASFTARLMLQNFKRLLLYGYPRRDLIIGWRRTFLGICLTVSVLSFFLNLIGSLVVLESTISVVMPCLIFIGQAAICFAMCYHHRVHAERC